MLNINDVTIPDLPSQIRENILYCIDLSCGINALKRLLIIHEFGMNGYELYMKATYQDIPNDAIIVHRRQFVAKAASSDVLAMRAARIMDWSQVYDLGLHSGIKAQFTNAAETMLEKHVATGIGSYAIEASLILEELLNCTAPQNVNVQLASIFPLANINEHLNDIIMEFKDLDNDIKYDSMLIRRLLDAELK